MFPQEFNDHKVAIAVSTGKDSMVLLHQLYSQGFDIVALHVNHQTRPECTSEENFIKKYCDNLSIPCYVLSPDSIIDHKNFEQNARDCRYELLINKTQELGISYLVTAHHQDDMIETVFLKLFRGSTHLFIPQIRKTKGIQIIRPLLQVSLKELDSYRIKHSIPFWEDPSNKDTKYRRNFIRHELIPLLENNMPNIKNHIVRASTIRQEEQEFIDSIVEQKIRDIFPDKECLLEEFLKEPIFIQKKILINKIQLFFQKSLSYKQIEELLNLVSSHKNVILFQHVSGELIKEYEKIIFLDKKQGQLLEKKTIIIHNREIQNQNHLPFYMEWDEQGGLFLDDACFEVRPYQKQDVLIWNNGHKKITQWIKDKKIMSHQKVWTLLKNNNIIGVIAPNHIYINPEHTVNKNGIKIKDKL